MPPAVEAQYPNHWTARELLGFLLIQDFSEWRQGCHLQLLLVLMQRVLLLPPGFRLSPELTLMVLDGPW